MISPDGVKGLVVEPGAVLARRGISVAERDPITDRPKKILGPSELALRQWAEKHRISINSDIQTEPISTTGVVTGKVHVVSPVLELAALKSLLLSFDHLLIDSPNPFTRSADLALVREVVRESVQREQAHELLHTLVLGIQLEKMELYAYLRQRMKVEQTPFEHVMLVGGNRAQRCIDGVWLVFGFEPFGFRLCDNYHGDDFCYGLVNPVVKGRGPTNLIELPLLDELLCRPTDRRSFQHSADEYEDLTQTPQFQRAVQEITSLRDGAFDRATELVHLSGECEDWLREQLYAVHVLERMEKMRDLLRFRILDLYPHCCTEDFRECVNTALCRAIDSCVDIDCNATVDHGLSVEGWQSWLRILRHSLQIVKERFGLPGGGFTTDIVGRIAGRSD
ncbi:MAG: hypothetical protein U0795_22845 [Pirellulales bacterium]